MAHFPVLLEEVIEALQLEPGCVVFDATAGGGGHSEEILKRILPDGKLIAVDRDPEAVERIEERFREYNGSVIAVNDDYRHVARILEKSGIEHIDGALFDLGMSSYQIDEGERGFSFLNDGPLDMRFDRREGVSVAHLVNNTRWEDLAEIIREYGEERHAKLVAKSISVARKIKPIETTGELARIVRDAVGSKYRRQKIHPAARTFQAFRIFINDELGAVEKGVGDTVDVLRSGGRICVISFHSLEDRIVKNIFRDRKNDGTIDVLTKKPLRPGMDEMRVNSRARSAKLRIAEKK